MFSWANRLLSCVLNTFLFLSEDNSRRLTLICLIASVVDIPVEGGCGSTCGVP